MSDIGWFEDGHWCNVCKRWQPEDAFRPDASRRSGLYPICRSCVSAAGRAWREKNAEHVAAQNELRRLEYQEARGDLTRTCENPDCAKTFTPSRVDAKFCSRKCRDRQKYLRKRETRS